VKFIAHLLLLSVGLPDSIIVIVGLPFCRSDQESYPQADLVGHHHPPLIRHPKGCGGLADRPPPNIRQSIRQLKIIVTPCIYWLFCGLPFYPPAIRQPIRQPPKNPIRQVIRQ
jgi:hypothetical protein